jgi:formylglycine-generating enzyme required for sulfatase activity
MRVTWNEAVAYCDWLSRKTGMKFSLPTEAQWEWACRAGTDTAGYWGSLDDDFSDYANVADLSIKKLAVSGVNPQPIRNPNQYQDWLPKDDRYDDDQRIMCEVGNFKPNAWGLKDMHGNVWEWTRSSFAAYPYNDRDGRNDLNNRAKKVVRGGSWHDRPKRVRSAMRLAYEPWQKVFNVGFRVICETEDTNTNVAVSRR